MRSQEMQSKVEVAVVAGLVRGPALLAAAGRADDTRAGAQPLVWRRPGAKGKRGAIAHAAVLEFGKLRKKILMKFVWERGNNLWPLRHAHRCPVQKRRVHLVRLPGGASMPAAAHAGAAAAGAAASRRRGRVQASRAADTNSAALPAPLPVRRRTAKNHPVVRSWSEDAGLPRTAGFRSRVWRVRGPGDVGDEGDSFERRVRFIETELRGCTDYDASQISTDDIAAELVRCRGHAGRAMRSLLPKKPPAGSTVEADREYAEDQPVLPEFMVAKITGLTTDRELQARRDTEIEMKWKMIDKSGNEDITLADFRILLAQLGIEKTDEDAEVVFQEIDADGNGGIDITEFEHWCVRAPTAASTLVFSSSSTTVCSHSLRYCRPQDEHDGPAGPTLCERAGPTRGA